MSDDTTPYEAAFPAKTAAVPESRPSQGVEGETCPCDLYELMVMHDAGEERIVSRPVETAEWCHYEEDGEACGSMFPFAPRHTDPAHPKYHAYQTAGDNTCSRCGEALIGQPRMCAIHGETGVRPAAVPPPPEPEATPVCDCSDQKPCSHFPEPEAAEAVLCETCGTPERGHPTPADHERYGHPFRAPSEAAPAAPPETPEPAPEHWRDDPTGWERTGEGVTSYGTDVVWSHPSRGSQVVSLGIERAIRADAVAELPREEMDEYRLNSLTEELAEVNADYRRLSEELTQAREHAELAWAEASSYVADTIAERDAARAEAEEMRAALEEEAGSLRGIHSDAMDALNSLPRAWPNCSCNPEDGPCYFHEYLSILDDAIPSIAKVAEELDRARQSPQEGK